MATNETIQVINSGPDSVRLSIQIPADDSIGGWVEQSNETITSGATSAAHWVAFNHKRVVVTSLGS